MTKITTTLRHYPPDFILFTINKDLTNKKHASKLATKLNSEDAFKFFYQTNEKYMPVWINRVYLIWLIVDYLAKKEIQAVERYDKSWSRVTQGFRKYWLQPVDEP